MAWLRGALALLTGAGRPITYTVVKIYKLEPETIERIKTIALANQQTESAVAEEFLRRMAEVKIHDARARVAGRRLRGEDH
jgi:hypothetical protein